MTYQNRKSCYKDSIASPYLNLLGITTDKRLSFKIHMENLCRHANYKLHAFRRIRKYLTAEKGNAFIDSQVNYAPLIWMFCQMMLYPKIEKIRHQNLRIIH